MSGQLDMFAPPRPTVHRALSFWQPYAWCVTDSTKRIDNRTRRPAGIHVGDWFAIFAVTTESPKRYREIAEKILASTGVVVPPLGSPELRYGCIVGAAQLTHVVDATDDPAMATLMRGTEPWWLGPVGLRLAPQVIAFPGVIPCKAPHQGPWTMPDELSERVNQRFTLLGGTP